MFGEYKVERDTMERLAERARELGLNVGGGEGPGMLLHTCLEAINEYKEDRQDSDERLAECQRARHRMMEQAPIYSVGEHGLRYMKQKASEFGLEQDGTATQLAQRFVDELQRRQADDERWRQLYQMRVSERDQAEEQRNTLHLELEECQRLLVEQAEDLEAKDAAIRALALGQRPALSHDEVRGAGRWPEGRPENVE